MKRTRFDLADINGHLHCGEPRPRGVLAATVKAPHVVTTHPTKRARVHRPSRAIVYNYDGVLNLGARFLCGGASHSVTALVDPESTALCDKCEAVASGIVSVYCYYDAEDRPLYVGQSGNVRARHLAHRSGSPWFSDVANMAILGEYPTLEAALVAEARAITELSPMHNIRQNLHLVRGGAA